MTPRGQTVATIEHAIEPPIDLSGDISALKRHMSDAMDRMNVALYDLQLDTDDCVVERFLGGRVDGASDVVWSPCISLTDAELICQSLLRSAGLETGTSLSVTLSAIRLEADRVPDYPGA